MNPKSLINEYFPNEFYVIESSVVDGEGNIYFKVDGRWLDIIIGDVELANILRDEIIAVLKATGRAVVLSNRHAQDFDLISRGY